MLGVIVRSFWDCQPIPTKPLTPRTSYDPRLIRQKTWKRVFSAAKPKFQNKLPATMTLWTPQLWLSPAACGAMGVYSETFTFPNVPEADCRAYVQGYLGGQLSAAGSGRAGALSFHLPKTYRVHGFSLLFFLVHILKQSHQKVFLFFCGSTLGMIVCPAGCCHRYGSHRSSSGRYGHTYTGGSVTYYPKSQKMLIRTPCDTSDSSIAARVRRGTRFSKKTPKQKDLLALWERFQEDSRPPWQQARENPEKFHNEKMEPGRYRGQRFRTCYNKEGYVDYARANPDHYMKSPKMRMFYEYAMALANAGVAPQPMKRTRKQQVLEEWFWHAGLDGQWAETYHFRFFPLDL